MVLNWENTILDPLAVLHLDNRPLMLILRSKIKSISNLLFQDQISAFVDITEKTKKLFLYTLYSIIVLMTIIKKK